MPSETLRKALAIDPKHQKALTNLGTGSCRRRSDSTRVSRPSPKWSVPPRPIPMSASSWRSKAAPTRPASNFTRPWPLDSSLSQPKAFLDYLDRPRGMVAPGPRKIGSYDVGVLCVVFVPRNAPGLPGGIEAGLAVLAQRNKNYPHHRFHILEDLASFAQARVSPASLRAPAHHYAISRRQWWVGARKLTVPLRLTFPALFLFPRLSRGMRQRSRGLRRESDPFRSIFL